jgi:hypothetical protein
MTIPECIRDYLTENRPVGFCDDGLQLKLGLARRQEVAPVTKTLGQTRVSNGNQATVPVARSGVGNW